MAKTFSVFLQDSLVNGLEELSKTRPDRPSRNKLIGEAVEAFLRLPKKVEEARTCSFCSGKPVKMFTLKDDSKVWVCWRHEKKVSKASVKSWKTA